MPLVGLHLGFDSACCSSVVTAAPAALRGAVVAAHGSASTVRERLLPHQVVAATEVAKDDCEAVPRSADDRRSTYLVPAVVGRLVVGVVVPLASYMHVDIVLLLQPCQDPRPGDRPCFMFGLLRCDLSATTKIMNRVVSGIPSSHLFRHALPLQLSRMSGDVGSDGGEGVLLWSRVPVVPGRRLFTFRNYVRADVLSRKNDCCVATVVIPAITTLGAPGPAPCGVLEAAAVMTARRYPLLPATFFVAAPALGALASSGIVAEGRGMAAATFLSFLVAIVHRVFTLYAVVQVLRKRGGG